MIPDLITPADLARVESHSDQLLRQAAAEPDDENLQTIVRSIAMLQELIDAHECIEERTKAIGAESPAAYHQRLAIYARQLRAERLTMLEFIL